MITYIDGDILNAKTEAIVIPVNCVGAMAEGLAFSSRRVFPANYEDYKVMCNKGKIKLGEMYLTENITNNNPRFIINFPTRNHWWDASNLGAIIKGLLDLDKILTNYGIQSVAIPNLGNHWEVITAAIEQHFKNKAIDIFIYESE